MSERADFDGLEDSGAVEFIRWRRRNGLSLAEAGKALGISRRMVAYYQSGDRKVPRTVLLAMQGWEVNRQSVAAAFGIG